MLTKQSSRALGAMSGTSLDGVDVAVIETDGERIMDFGPSHYRPYSTEEQAVLRAHLGRWPADGVTDAANVVHDAHIDAMHGFENIDIAGFHGQTLAHDPDQGRTHQCGDGAQLAHALGYPVVWDFRSADVQAGGQGAPLAPFYHFALAKWMGAKDPIAILNLGGVGNITWIDPTCANPDAPGALLAFDTGPANAPVNDLMQARLGVAFDEGGQLAASGQVDDAVMHAFLNHPYFQLPPPKSLDRDAFAGLLAAVSSLSDADAAATLTQAAVLGVAQGMAHCPTMPVQLFVAGGGRQNQTMMANLSAAVPCSVSPIEKAGLNGDMLEAQAFAFLAVRIARGLPTSAPNTTGCARPISGGVVARPS